MIRPRAANIWDKISTRIFNTIDILGARFVFFIGDVLN
jgi:hypothetical protein